MDNVSDSSDSDTASVQHFVPLATKNEICDLIINHDHSQSELSNTHGIEKIPVRQWVSKVRRGRILHEKRGRPRLVDAEVTEAIKIFMMENSDVSDDELRVFIRQEYDVSCKRKRNDTFEVDTDHSTIKYKIKRLTLYRLVRQLRDEQLIKEHV